MRIAVDLSSLLWTCLRAGKDPEGKEVEHEGKPRWVNSAMFAYEKVINSITAALRDTGLTPTALVLVEEGMHAKRRRLMIDNTYKVSRGTKHEAEYEQYQALRDKVVGLLQGLGAIRCSQEGVEGDDILGWLARNTREPMVIHTFDNDLMVLHGENQHGAHIEVRVKGEHGVNTYGPFDHKLITTYKALVGDSSDNIKGCPGFGPAKFIDLMARYGEDGVAELQGLLEAGSLAPLGSLESDPLIRMLLSNEKQVIKCYRLAKIHDEWVNTADSQLEWYGGMVTENYGSDERLRRFRQQRRLVTTENAVAAYEFLKSKVAETPWFSFDIETSSCDESDEWMESQGTPDGVDVLGHRLTGFSITFGANHQYTFYVSVQHRDTANLEVEDARAMIEVMCESGKHIVIQNTSFEGAVLATEEDNGKTWQEWWKDNGFRGFIPNWLDTVFEASYVNENLKLGLKERSQIHLGYTQQTFMETVCKTGKLTELPAGGKVIKVLEWEAMQARDEAGYPVFEEDGVTPVYGGEKRPSVVTKQYKMKELTAAEVFDYGCDDTICTAALHNLYMLIMQLEGTWQVYLDVEIDASYQHVKNFLDGKNFSLETMREQERDDDKTYNEAWAKVRDFLISKNWGGTVPPTYTQGISAKEIKEAYTIYQGIEEEEDEDTPAEEADDGPVYHAEQKAEKPKDPILSSRVRTASKFPALLRAEGVDELFVQALEACLAGDAGAVEFTALIRSRFKGEPVFKISPKQMQKLLYEAMELPVRVRNKPTAKMKQEGIYEGTPKTDALAIKYALMEATPEQKAVLEGLQLMQMVKTRRSLYYSKYPGFVHWKTGKIHSSHRQCATNTRRASSAKPNEQQLPKHVKIEGQAARFRQCIVPHKKNAVVVSLDFVQQELVLIAELSQDPNMLACYQGDSLKDMHILTGLGILNKQKKLGWSYETFKEALDDKEHVDYKMAKEFRSKGKTTNFATEYGAMAEKLAQTMLVSEEEAQDYIDAREETFPVVKEWKEGVVEQAKRDGYVLSMLGARRHLAAAFNSEDRWEASKAERQAVNYKIQGSSAEQTKLAEGRVWQQGLTFKFDAVCYGPIHDELVFSVALEDLLEFLPQAHACMTANYAGMKLPNRSSISLGLDFGRQIEIGEAATAEAINDGLMQMREAA